MTSRLLLATSLAALAMLLHAYPAFAQDEDSEEPIREAFLSLGVQPPELGWLLSSDELVTELSAQNLTVLSSAHSPSTATHTGIIPADAVKAFVRKHQVDCDQVDDPNPTPLHRYATKVSAPPYPSQVLLVSSQLNGKITVGFEDYKASPSELAAVWQSMSYSSDQKRLFRSVRQAGSTFFYTFAATYSQDQTILRKGIFLQDSTGRIIGHEIETLNGDQECDGCAVLTYKDGIQVAYYFEKLLTLPSSPYPLVLIDSSTVEGRATELFTFTPDGKPSRYRQYEYVVTCILGSAEQQARP